MKLTDFTNNTLDNIKKEMEYNGYSWFNEEAYKAKDDTPCFIPENGDDLSDVFSWQDLFNETLAKLKTRDFILAVCENYNKPKLINYLETVDNLDYNQCYLTITGETPEKFAEEFMDDYFLSGGEVWCYLSTRLEDYMM